MLIRLRLWVDMEKVLSGENDKEQKGRVGVRDVLERARRLNSNKQGEVRREASSVWFHTLRLESSQSITEGLSISSTLLLAVQYQQACLQITDYLNL